MTQTEKDRDLESLHDQETSSRQAMEKCRQLEASCDRLKNEKEECLQRITRLQADSGALLRVDVICDFKGCTFTIFGVKGDRDRKQ